MLNIYYVKYTYTYISPAQILHFIIIKLVVHIFFIYMYKYILFINIYYVKYTYT